MPYFGQYEDRSKLYLLVLVIYELPEELRLKTNYHWEAAVKETLVELVRDPLWFVVLGRHHLTTYQSATGHAFFSNALSFAQSMHLAIPTGDTFYLQFNLTPIAVQRIVARIGFVREVALAKLLAPAFQTALKKRLALTPRE